MSLVGHCRLLYEFTAENDSELSVPEDAVVEVLEARNDGWVLAKFNAKLGLVPESYVERLLEESNAAHGSNGEDRSQKDKEKDKPRDKDKDKKRDKDKQKDRPKDKERESKRPVLRESREKFSQDSAPEKDKPTDREKRKVDSEKVARRRSGELRTTDSLVRSSSESPRTGSSSASRFKTLSAAKLKQELKAAEEADPGDSAQESTAQQFAPPLALSPTQQRALPSIPKRAVSGILPKIPPKPLRAAGMHALCTYSLLIRTAHLGSPPPVPAKTIRPKSGVTEPVNGSPASSPGPSEGLSPVQVRSPVTLVRSSSMRGPERPEHGPFVPDQERDQQRFFIIKELLNTEKSYVAGLKETIDKYYKPMLSIAQAKSDPMLSSEDLRLIFSQLENLLPLNQNLLQSMLVALDRSLSHHSCRTGRAHRRLECHANYWRCFRQICSLLENVFYLQQHLRRCAGHPRANFQIRRVHSDLRKEIECGESHHHASPAYTKVYFASRRLASENSKGTPRFLRHREGVSYL